ncbi:MAG: heme o synthase [Sphingomonadales bacterium]
MARAKTINEGDILNPAVEDLADFNDFWVLVKPRVMSLSIFTALVGLLLAPGTIHPVLGFSAILFTAMGAAASGALNMWFDADIDTKMLRTKKRPIPAGRLDKKAALGFGIFLTITSVVYMALLINCLAAGLLAGTIFFYVVVYSMLLKRRTPQNIVIGGAAGAIPPMIGWAAVTGTITLEPILLFLIIFFWTPAHFWALAISLKEDYAKANLPMLPNVAGNDATYRQILIYTTFTVVLSFAPVVIGMSGSFYALIAGIFGFLFMGRAVTLFIRGTDYYAKNVFLYSILYLFVIFTTLAVDHYIGGYVKGWF